MYHRLFLILLIFTFFKGNTQNFGGFPPNTKWKQMESDTARIVFTPKADLHAKRVADVLHRMAAIDNKLGDRVRKVNIVLHSNTTLANGYVALAPFRSEFYLVPGGNIFDFGNIPWAEQLAIHEYRHVQQYNNFNRGLSKVARILIGQEGQALANALSVPDWFFEGDAVYAETFYTPQGRGRMPFFFNGYTSLWKEGRNYNWMKLRNGSLKDFVPSHYPLGYMLVNYGYEHYGPEFWGKVTRDASAFKGLFYPFQRAVKKHSGVSFKTFRNQALRSYSHETSKKRDDVKYRETYTDFLMPQIINDDSLIYLKSGYKDIPAFYIKDSKGEHKIRKRDISNEEWLSYRNGQIAYTAYSTHARWSLQDNSDIMLLDLQSGEQKRLTRKSKYFTPDIAPDSKSLVAVHVTDSLLSELHFLDMNGNLTDKRRAPAGALFVHPRFIDTATLIVGIRHASSKISMHKLDLNNMKFEQLLPAGYATSGYFYPYNRHVYFVSSLSGRDEIYALRLADKVTFQITMEGIGNYFPHVSGNMLTWSTFTSNGFKIKQLPFDSLYKQEVEPGLWTGQQEPFHVAGADSAINILTTPARDHEIKAYKKSTGLFNFHSWRPLYEDPELSLTLYSNNVLNTFSNEIFYRYNQNELSHAAGFNAAYAGWFPVVRAGVEYIGNRHLRTPTATYTLATTEYRLGYYIPLNLTRGRTYKFFTSGSDIIYNQTNPIGASKSVLRGGDVTYFHHFLNWRQQLPMVRKHIFPKLGYAFSGSIRQRFDDTGYQYNAALNVFLPSLARAHSIVLGAGWQEVNRNAVIFSNRFANARGYDDVYFRQMWRASANYHMPLIYADRGFANIAYLLRIRSNFFFDYSRVSVIGSLKSTGTEIFFDTKWWNQLPVSFGIRYSYLLDAEKFGLKDRNAFAIVLPVNLIPE